MPLPLESETRTVIEGGTIREIGIGGRFDGTIRKLSRGRLCVEATVESQGPIHYDEDGTRYYPPASTKVRRKLVRT